jgi:hypothetical protein
VATTVATAVVLRAQETRAGRDVARTQAAEEELARLIGDFHRVRERRAKPQQTSAESRSVATETGPVPPPAEVDAVFARRAADAAARYSGTDEAVPFLAWILTNTHAAPEAQANAFQTLAAAHASSDRLADQELVFDIACDAIPKRIALSGLDRIVAANRNPRVQALACLARGKVRFELAHSDAERSAARADLLRVAEWTQDEELLDLAKRRLYEHENLRVGLVAPEIAARDVRGAPLRLSDHRGRVVLLGFWGFW